MNHLVFLDAGAGELEKILSGVKCMVIKKFDPEDATSTPVRAGDTLFFLKHKDACELRVKAIVLRVISFNNVLGEELSHTLKEVQPRLQLTESQYNHWSTQKNCLLVEFTRAEKMEVIHVAPDKIGDRPDWIAFEEFSLIA